VGLVCADHTRRLAPPPIFYLFISSLARMALRTSSGINVKGSAAANFANRMTRRDHIAHVRDDWRGQLHLSGPASMLACGSSVFFPLPARDSFFCTNTSTKEHHHVFC